MLDKKLLVLVPLGGNNAAGQVVANRNNTARSSDKSNGSITGATS